MNTPILNKSSGSLLLKTIIIDDEVSIRETLRTYLSIYCPQVKVIGEAGSVEEAEALIRRNPPDLLLLDIHLDGGTGFDLLNRFDAPDFRVIFITAHDEYALKAFRVSAVDFILKPINPLEIADAVIRAQQLLQHDSNIKLQALKTNLQPGNFSGKKLVIKTHENIYLVDIDTITHCLSDTVYTTIFTSDSKSIMTSKPIKDYEEMLSGFGFFRVHRSYLINLSHIKRFEKREGGQIILTNNYQIPVATRKREEMLNLLNEMAE